jgi:hypothetical protein
LKQINILLRVKSCSVSLTGIIQFKCNDFLKMKVHVKKCNWHD